MEELINEISDVGDSANGDALAEAVSKALRQLSPLQDQCHPVIPIISELGIAHCEYMLAKETE